MIDGVELIQKLYGTMKQKHEAARKAFGRPLTLAEKILIAHMPAPVDEDGKTLVKKKSYANLFPDRVALQDATAQMALLQFMQAGKKEVAVPSTVHCDHLISAQKGAKPDLLRAIDENQEVYDFLQTVSQKYGLGFWKPGAGIIHQVVLENYAFPGGMMIGTDSHTPNAGGLGMVAIGIGGADAVDVMAGFPLNLRWPGVIGVKLTGTLQGFAAPKDVILKLMGILTVKGGTNHIVEFFGPGAASISATGKGTIANMGAEHGATTSVFAYDEAMERYLRATHRGAWADLANAHKAELAADPEVYADPTKFYDQVVEIDLSTLDPHLVGPHTPDLAHPVQTMKEKVQKEGWPAELTSALIGSCTNSSYEDVSRAASLAKAALDAGLKAKVPFLISPGSETIHLTIQRDGQMATFGQAGGTVLTNACGPCIGQWDREDVKKGTKNTIVTSFNRNFRGRQDSNPETLAFIGSPEQVTAMAFSGRLDFDPRTDTIKTTDGRDFKFPQPTGDELPKQGFLVDKDGFLPPAADGSKINIAVDAKSRRLALLDPFAPWDGKDITGARVLMKAKGKCTTDHISAAGKWLTFRGHLDNIANNTFIGATNAFNDKVGEGKSLLDGSTKAYPDVARAYKAAGVPWIAVGDENYGEGSSREHAAMQPRHLGGRAILVRSFARIHESNLKKQGMLPLTFASAVDYDKVREDDLADIVGLTAIAPGQPLMVRLHHADGTKDEFAVNHTLSAEQIEWFKAGSALNLVAAQQKKA
ncbi:MAG: aconitate hydratase [Deltaproteobacteria bacterium]|nr:aconitate hydratase [Deltaproteobacteria bacterium]